MRYQVRPYGLKTFRVFDTKRGVWASPGAFTSKRKAQAFASMCNSAEVSTLSNPHSKD